MVRKIKPKRDPRSQVARREAAKAVVSVRLGLPLKSVDIEPRRVVSASGQAHILTGRTTFTEGVVEGCHAA